MASKTSKKIFHISAFYLLAFTFLVTATTLFGAMRENERDSVSLPNTAYPSQSDEVSRQRNILDSENRFTPSATPQNNSAVSKDSNIKNGEPKKLLIPSLSIDAPIIRVGINAKGSMASPGNFKEVGWYGRSALPGSPGNAIMAGHVNNGLGLSGVFKDLAKIKKGDTVKVTLNNGETRTFKVSAIETSDWDGKTDSIFERDSGPSRLVLITCYGSWLPFAQTYSKRLVVYADSI